MILYINTASPEEIILALREGKRVVAQKKIKAPRRQGEKLLPSIAALLAAQKIRLSALKKIVVVNHGGSFTSLRIGVITANALAYSLGIPVEAEDQAGKKDSRGLKKFGRYSLAVPAYDRPPEIGRGQKSSLRV